MCSSGRRANTSSGNGLVAQANIPVDTYDFGATVPCSVQIKRSAGGSAQLAIDWLNRKGDVITGFATTLGSVSAAAGTVVTLSGNSLPRPYGGVKLRISATAPTAAAGETIQATNFAVGTSGNGAMSGWQWLANADTSASYKL